MDNLASGTHKKFNSLLDALEAEHFSSQASNAAGIEASGSSVLGPSVGDDAVRSPAIVNMLGPSVGDDAAPLPVR